MITPLWHGIIEPKPQDHDAHLNDWVTCLRNDRKQWGGGRVLSMDGQFATVRTYQDEIVVSRLCYVSVVRSAHVAEVLQ